MSSLSYQLNQQFAEDIINTNYFLDEAVDWIKGSLSPEDVFDSDALEEWARENDFVKEDE